MTVSTLTNSVIYLGNGSATSFAVPFKVLDVDHLVVQRRVKATGYIDYTYVGTDYSYSGIGDDSGTLTLNGAALSSTYELVIERVVPYTQGLDLVNAGGFYPETVEEQLDLTTMQVQQIAAQSDDIEARALMVPVGEEAPTYEDFAATFRGDPGGDATQVGTYAAAELMTISAAIDKIQLTDRDRPIYVRVDAEPMHPGKLESAGGWWELWREQWIKPTFLDDPEPGDDSLRWTPPSTFNLGDVRNQVAEGCPDATLALQRMREMQAAGYKYLDYDGHWGVTTGIVIGADVATPKSPMGVMYRGHCTILALTAIDTLINLQNVGFSTWDGRLEAGGIGTTYASRTCGYGIVFTEWNSYFKIDVLFAAGFLYDGVIMDGSASNSAHYMNIGKINCTRCGSGLINNDTGQAYYLAANWSNVDNVTGLASNSTNQFTRITVSADIPLAAMTYQEAGHYQLWYVAAGRCYRIKAIDRDANTIDLYPAVPDNFPASGTGQYIIPGGFREYGGDAGNNHISVVECNLVSTSYMCGSQYPSQIPTVVGQSSTVAYMSRAEGHAQAGGWVEAVYCENNTWNLVIFNGENNQCGIGNLAPATGLSKIICPARHIQPTVETAGPPVRTHAWDMEATSAGLGLFALLRINGVPLRNQRKANSDPVLTMDATGEDLYRWHYDDRTGASAIPIRSDLDILRIAGGRRKSVEITGSGTHGEPTVGITFSMEAGKRIRLESGAWSATGGSLSFLVATHKQPLKLEMEADYISGDVTVTYINRPTIGGWGTPSGTATRTTFDTTTVTLPQLAERVKALIDDNLTRGASGT